MWTKKAYVEQCVYWENLMNISSQKWSLKIKASDWLKSWSEHKLSLVLSNTVCWCHCSNVNGYNSFVSSLWVTRRLSGYIPGATLLSTKKCGGSCRSIPGIPGTFSHNSHNFNYPSNTLVVADNLYADPLPPFKYISSLGWSQAVGISKNGDKLLHGSQPFAV